MSANLTYNIKFCNYLFSIIGRRVKIAIIHAEGYVDTLCRWHKELNLAKVMCHSKYKCISDTFCLHPG